MPNKTFKHLHMYTFASCHFRWSWEYT